MPKPAAYDPAGTTVVSASDIGRVRNLNQDDCGEFVDAGSGTHLLVVADGMGGHRGGEVASQIAVQQIGDVFKRGTSPDAQALLEQALREANQCIFERANNEAELEGMGTTAVALLLDGQHEAVLGHVGDSRAYRMRQGKLEQLTADHSVVGELVRRGQLSPEEARHHPQSNEILRALGTRSDVEIEFTRVDVQPGDQFLMCSDGLSGMLSDQAIAQVLSEHPADEVPPRLIELATIQRGRAVHHGGRIFALVGLRRARRLPACGTMRQITRLILGIGPPTHSSLSVGAPPSSLRYVTVERCGCTWTPSLPSSRSQ